MEHGVYVEVKMHGALLIAVSHLEMHEDGSVHVWTLSAQGVSGHRARRFARPPDRVEARHGGNFLEVCFTPLGSWPMGVQDVLWLDPTDASLRTLLRCDASISDWRCDLRDGLALVSEGAQTLHYHRLWP